MPAAEFDVINKYFSFSQPHQAHISLGIGDDGAIVAVPHGYQQVLVSDMLNADVHFFADGDPADIAWKAVAVNLSDLAAMGATPHWILLALALPVLDHAWLTQFSHGLQAVCTRYQVSLVGGDTTQGPLSMTVTAGGLVPNGKAILRSGAQLGDWIVVSGPLGGAGLGLAYARGEIALDEVAAAAALQQLNKPLPQVTLGACLGEFAHAAIDISDGLLSDLGHILKASGVGARLHYEAVPRWPVANDAMVFTQGDAYQLCFTLPDAAWQCLRRLPEARDCQVIGHIIEHPGLHVVTQQGEQVAFESQGFAHF